MLFNGKIVSHEVGNVLKIKADTQRDMQILCNLGICWVGTSGGALDIDPEDEMTMVVSKAGTQGCDTQGCLNYISSLGTLS